MAPIDKNHFDWWTCRICRHIFRKKEELIAHRKKKHFNLIVKKCQSNSEKMKQDEATQVNLPSSVNLSDTTISDDGAKAMTRGFVNLQSKSSTSPQMTELSAENAARARISLKRDSGRAHDSFSVEEKMKSSYLPLFKNDRQPFVSLEFMTIKSELTSLQRSPSKLYLYKCEICSLRYKKIACLIQHKKSHSATSKIEIKRERSNEGSMVKSNSFSSILTSTAKSEAIPNIKEKEQKSQSSKVTQPKETLALSLQSQSRGINSTKEKGQSSLVKINKVIGDHKSYETVTVKLLEMAQNYIPSSSPSPDPSESDTELVMVEGQRASTPIESDEWRRIKKFYKNGRVVYACGYCSKEFQAISSLENHIRVHTGEKSFGCRLPNCQQFFRTKGEQNRHERFTLHSVKKSKKLPQNLAPPEGQEEVGVIQDRSGIRYCLCNWTSYGRMVECDNEYCAHGQWFHFPCVNLVNDPTGSWYCPPCASVMKR